MSYFTIFGLPCQVVNKKIEQLLNLRDHSQLVQDELERLLGDYLSFIKTNIRKIEDAGHRAVSIEIIGKEVQVIGQDKVTKELWPRPRLNNSESEREEVFNRW